MHIFCDRLLRCIGAGVLIWYGVFFAAVVVGLARSCVG